MREVDEERGMQREIRRHLIVRVLEDGDGHAACWRILKRARQERKHILTIGIHHLLAVHGRHHDILQQAGGVLRLPYVGGQGVREQRLPSIGGHWDVGGEGR